MNPFDLWFRLKDIWDGYSRWICFTAGALVGVWSFIAFLSLWPH